MEIYQRSRLPVFPFLLPRLRIEHAYGYGAMGSSYGCEFDIANRMRLLGGEIVDAEDFEMVPALVVEGTFAAQTERGVVVEE